jgi:hypothetical protein
LAYWEGGTLSIQTTDHFKCDAEQQTFTLYRADDSAQFAYSMVRFKKLTADRYKGWALSVPDQFEELAREHAFPEALVQDGRSLRVRKLPANPSAERAINPLGELPRKSATAPLIARSAALFCFRGDPRVAHGHRGDHEGGEAAWD